MVECLCFVNDDDGRRDSLLSCGRPPLAEGKRSFKLRKVFPRTWHVRQVHHSLIQNQQHLNTGEDSALAGLYRQLSTMATPRSMSFYKNILLAIKSCRPNTYRSIRTVTRPTRSKAHLHTSRRAAQETFPQRYGPAASSSLPPPSKPSEQFLPSQDQPPKKEAVEREPEQQDEPPKVEPSEAAAAPETRQEDTAEDEPASKIGDGEPLKNKELDMVLSIPSPSEMKSDPHRHHPHLEASPYEHHFDTYSLVQQLAKEEGFTQEQAVTLMKAIRLMLAVNLDIAKEGLVSKSDTENETYLFRAACSELRTTLQIARQSEISKQRSTRALLSHEADILNQKFTQDMLSLREDLKAMFNDRKMSLQEEKRRIDGKISELNYEITVLLNSDSKSEVEGLRWVLTRRAALAIAAAACELPFIFFCLALLILDQSWSSPRSTTRQSRRVRGKKSRRSAKLHKRLKKNEQRRGIQRPHELKARRLRKVAYKRTMKNLLGSKNIRCPTAHYRDVVLCLL